MRPNSFLKKRSGIYGIYNPDIGKIYIGRTNDMFRRCSQYRYDFEKDRSQHLNDYLRAAMRKHGFDNFVFFPIEFCDECELQEKELKWMRVLKSTDRRYGYNLRTDTSGGMNVHSDTKEKIRQNLIRQWASGVRDGHSEKLKLSWHNNPSRKEKQGELFKKYKTKYVYVIKPQRGRSVTVKYERLEEFGLKTVISQFHRKKSNEVMCKGYRVTRRLIDEDEL